MPIKITHDDYVITVRRQNVTSGYCVTVYKDMSMDEVVAMEIGFPSILDCLTWLKDQPFIHGHKA